MLTFETLRKKDLGRLVELQTNAFMNYDYFSCCVPDERRRRRFLTNLFRSDARANWGREHFLAAVDEDGRIVAVAALQEPGYEKPSDAAYLKAGFWRAILASGYKAMKDWLALEDEAIAPCRERVDDWFVNALVVDPDTQGRGVGTTFMQEGIIPYVRAHGGKGLCLFTNAEINRRFYEKSGFLEFDERFFEVGQMRVGSWSYSQAL